MEIMSPVLHSVGTNFGLNAAMELLVLNFNQIWCQCENRES